MKRHAKKTRALYAQKNNISFIKYIRSSRRGGGSNCSLESNFRVVLLLIFCSNVSYLFKYVCARLDSGSISCNLCMHFATVFGSFRQQTSNRLFSVQLRHSNVFNGVGEIRPKGGSSLPSTLRLFSLFVHGCICMDLHSERLIVRDSR